MYETNVATNLRSFSSSWFSFLSRFVLSLFRAACVDRVHLVILDGFALSHDDALGKGKCAGLHPHAVSSMFSSVTLRPSNLLETLVVALTGACASLNICVV